MRNVGLLIFDDAEELDFMGPWEVFSYAAKLTGRDRVLTVAASLKPVRCAKGMQVLPDAPLADAPPLDVVLVPGGIGTRREVANPEIIGWLQEVCPQATWVTRVCTGSLLPHEAGPARGKRVTTHWSFVETLRARGDIT